MKTICVILSLFIVSCSTFQPSSPSIHQYFPLSIGNKWIYDSRIVREVVSLDTIKNRTYYKIKTSTIEEGHLSDYFYWQRIANDTLFLLNYDSKTDQYNEFVDAIFSLNENEIAQIHLSRSSKVPSNPLEWLPSGSEYSIKVLSKKDDIIEFFIRRRAIDLNSTAVYKKGVGIIKTRNDWGIESKLTDYKIH